MEEPSEDNSYADFPNFRKFGGCVAKGIATLLGIGLAKWLVDKLFLH